MEQNSTTTNAESTGLFAGEAWFDPIEAGIRDRVRGFIEELLEQELTQALGARSARAGRGGAERLSERDPRAPASRIFWPGADQRAACPDGGRGRQHAGMA